MQLHDYAGHGMAFGAVLLIGAPFLLKQRPAGAYAAALAVAEREALKMRLRKRLLGDGPDRPIALHARAWAVRGTVR